MAVSRDYYSASTRQERRRRRRGRLALVLFICFGLILLLAWGITALLEPRFGEPAAPSESVISSGGGIATDLLAPLPMQGGGGVVTGTRGVYGPVRQHSGAYTVLPRNAAVLARRACGQADLTYFSDAAFLGDSLTVGFSDYRINLSGALICGYVGVSPKQVVDRAELKSSERGNEVALEVLQAAAPKKLYVLLGTNTLVSEGGTESFLAYYAAMLDELRAMLGEDCLIYVQSVPPVRPTAVESRPGLTSERLREVNEALARLADEKGCAYLDLWQALADEAGDLNATLAEQDGVHLKGGAGYSAWVNYLRTHTVYSPDTPWTPGSAYAP